MQIDIASMPKMFWSFDIRILKLSAAYALKTVRVSTCPPLPEMPAHKLTAVSGVGRRVFEFAAYALRTVRISPSLISGLNVTKLTTCYFANLEYGIYETGY